MPRRDAGKVRMNGTPESHWDMAYQTDRKPHLPQAVRPMPEFPKFNLGKFQKARKVLVKPEQKPVFMVDLDSTIFAMEDVMRDCVKLVTGIYPKPAHTWECEVAWGVSPDTATKIWDLVWQHDMKPYPGAFNFLNRLRERYKVISLSTRKLGAPRNHGIAMAEDLPVDTKIWTSSPEEKGAHVKNSKALFFLDDSPSNHFAVFKKQPITDLLLLDRPWNQSQDISPIWRRVYSYEEVLKIAFE